MTLKITDTHAHYNDVQFDDNRKELLDRLFEESCENIITVGWNTESSRLGVILSDFYDRMYAAVGVHPNEELVPDNYISIIRILAQRKKVVAIGEIGLDYHWISAKDDEELESIKNEQKVRFIKQIALAKEMSLPIIVHSRDAMKDTLDILSQFRPEGVMHCFSGSAESAAEVTRLGMMISFTGAVTFKNAKKAVQACRETPIESIMLETDCPYMAPEPHRGKTCHSGYLIHTAEKIAQIKDMKTQDVISICNENARRLFKLPAANQQ